MRTYTPIISMVVIFGFLSLSCVIHAQQTFLQQDLGEDSTQGLKYIDEEAASFVHDDNQKHQTHWKVLEPDAKMIVSKSNLPTTRPDHITSH